MYQYGKVSLFLQDIIAYTTAIVNSFAEKFFRTSSKITALLMQSG